MASLQEYLFISGLLFAIGLAGVLVRRNIIVIFMCLELMLSSANLTLVAFSRFNTGTSGLPDYNGQVLVFNQYRFSPHFFALIIYRDKKFF